MCVLGLPQGQTIKEHLKRWQSSVPKRRRGGVCRCMESMCMFSCMCARGNVRVCVCCIHECTVRSLEVFLGRVCLFASEEVNACAKNNKGSIRHHLTTIYAPFFSWQCTEGATSGISWQRGRKERTKREREREHERAREWDYVKESSERVFVGP